MMSCCNQERFPIPELSTATSEYSELDTEAYRENLAPFASFARDDYGDDDTSDRSCIEIESEDDTSVSEESYQAQAITSLSHFRAATGTGYGANNESSFRGNDFEEAESDDEKSSITSNDQDKVVLNLAKRNMKLKAKVTELVESLSEKESLIKNFKKEIKDKDAHIAQLRRTPQDNEQIQEQKAQFMEQAAETKLKLHAAIHEVERLMAKANTLTAATEEVAPVLQVANDALQATTPRVDGVEEYRHHFDTRAGDPLKDVADSRTRTVMPEDDDVVASHELERSNSASNIQIQTSSASWTEEEYAKLRDLVMSETNYDAQGRHCWTKIAQHFDGRSPDQCKYRWKISKNWKGLPGRSAGAVRKKAVSIRSKTPREGGTRKDDVTSAQIHGNCANRRSTTNMHVPRQGNLVNNGCSQKTVAKSGDLYKDKENDFVDKAIERSEYDRNIQKMHSLRRSSGSKREEDEAVSDGAPENAHTRPKKKRQRKSYEDAYFTIEEDSKWTPEEDSLLETLHQHFGNSWKHISGSLPGRTIDAIRSRWFRILRRNGTEGRQTTHDDGRLSRLPEVKRYCPPGAPRAPWTDKEDAILWYVQEIHGSCWQDLQEYLPGRSAKACERRWGRIRLANKPKTAMCPAWTAEVDATLTHLHERRVINAPYEILSMADGK